MAWDLIKQEIGTKFAGEDMTAARGKAVVFNSLDRWQIAGLVGPLAGEAHGILTNNPDNGGVASVQVFGVAMAKLGGTVTGGRYLDIDANGDLIEAHPGGQVGVALDSGVAGSLIPVLLVNRSSVTGSIDDLDDVDTSTNPPDVGDHLAWDGNNWVPVAPMTFGEYKGIFDASIGTFPVTPNQGDWFNCTVAGTVDGQNFAIGDILIALVDTPSTVTFAGNWSVIPNISVTDHTLLTNIGVNTHAQIDTHIADGTLHFTEASIDHDNIANNGVASHATIDSHIGTPSIHFTMAAIDHTVIGNIGTNSHAAIDLHIADTGIHFGDAPADGQPYERVDNSWAVAGGGGSTITAAYRWRTETAEADPGAGRIRYDNATPASVTELYVSETTDDGGDFTNILGFLSAGDQVYFQVDADSADYLLMTITGTVDNGGWWTLQGTVTNSGTLPSNNDRSHILILFGGTGGGAPAVAPPARSITIENPTAADDFVLFFAEDEMVVNQINFVIRGGTSATVEVRFAADRSAAGTLVINAGTIVNNQTVGQEITSFDNDTIPAGSWVWVEVTAISGVPDEVNVSLRFDGTP